MEKQIIFHIGYPKTGTSFLQALFEDEKNKRRFEQLGLGYSRHITKPDYLEEVKFIDDCDYLELKDNLNSWFEKTKCQKLLISNEAYVHISKQGIKKLYKASENIAHPKVIIYIRRQDYICESSWKQWGLFNHPFEVEYKNFITKGLKYSKLLDNWAEEFGLENVIVRIHDKEKLKNGIAFDFFKALGIEYEGIILPAKSVNSGFDIHTLNVSYLSRDLMKDEHDNTINELLSKYNIGEKNIYSGYNLLTDKQRVEIIEYHDADNKYVLQKYFNNEYPELFSKFYSSNDEKQPVVKTTFEDIVPIFMAIMLGQEQRIKILERRLDNLKNNKFIKLIRKFKVI